MRRTEYVLGIDQGTTGTTVLAFDASGRLRSRGYAEFPQHYPRPGWVEHRGDEIWRATLLALRGALRPLGGRGSAGRARTGSAAGGRPGSGRAGGPRIAAIGITNQRETSILWERSTSKPVAPAIVWQDRRTSERCEALRRAGEERAISHRTGLRLDPYFSATKVEWLLRNTPGLRARARKGTLAFGTVDSWLLWRLTGGRVHATDPTNASRTLLYDIRRLAWDRGLLDLFGVPEPLLPEVRPSCGDFGVTRGVPGLSDGIPIRGVAGDQQAALFGQGCVRAGGLKNTYGTGCFLLLHTGSRPVPSRAGLLTTVACGPHGEARYALEGSVFIAGAAIQWLRDGLRILTRAKESESIARAAPDAGGTFLVPAFAGLGAPHWKADARGIWCGLTRGTTRAHLVRAALESIAYQSRDLVEAMEGDAGITIRELRVDGGASANDFLMQFQADLLGVKLIRPGLVETTALGAALLAGIGIGLWRGAEDLGAVGRTGRTFRPRMRGAERERLYQGWKKAVALLL